MSFVENVCVHNGVWDVVQEDVRIGGSCRTEGLTKRL